MHIGKSHANSLSLHSKSFIYFSLSLSDDNYIRLDKRKVFLDILKSSMLSSKVLRLEIDSSHMEELWEDLEEHQQKTARSSNLPTRIYPDS